MLNSLAAKEGNDFEYLNASDIKNKLPIPLIALWEVLEAANLDIIEADGHPLGKTFKFKLDVTKNDKYSIALEKVQKEPLYSEYNISVNEIEPGKIVHLVFEQVLPA